MGKKANIENKISFGLIGKSLEYSFSRSYFTQKFLSLGLSEASYQNFEFSNERTLANFLLDEVYSLKGFNVTIPYKETIIPYLDTLSGVAKDIQSVNTVLVKENKLIGYNTDVYGFLKSVKSLIKKHHKKALVLGSGGVSKSVVHALSSIDIEISMVSRKSTNKDVLEYKNIDENIMRSHKIIVNCSPVGTFPKIEVCPNIPYQYVDHHHLVYDLVYNPMKTLFLSRSEAQGAIIQNGLAMLQLQAEESWRIWNS